MAAASWPARWGPSCGFGHRTPWRTWASSWRANLVCKCCTAFPHIGLFDFKHVVVVVVVVVVVAVAVAVVVAVAVAAVVVVMCFL